MKIPTYILFLSASVAFSQSVNGIIGAISQDTGNINLGSGIPDYASENQEAFIGALGYGALSEGGRGKSVHIVENLFDSGAGSFREGFEDPNVGHIVFNGLSGNIVITSTLSRTGSGLTVHGQTGNIAIVSSKASPPSSALMQITGSDITLRYLRFRRHGESDNTNQSGVQIIKGENIIVDNCSFSWMSDDLLSIAFRGANNVSVTNNLFSESTTKTDAVSSNNASGTGKGLLLYEIERLSVHRNVFYGVGTRNMAWSNQNAASESPYIVNETSHGEMFNNFAYDYSGQGMGIGGSSVAQDVLVNWVGNVTVESPNVYAGRYGMAYTNDRATIYAKDNLSNSRTSDSQDEHLAFGEGSGASSPADLADFILFPYSFIEDVDDALPSNQVESALMNSVGASHNVDSEDASVFSRIASRTVGKYRDRDDDGGISNVTYPTLSGNSFTSTVTGIPDSFSGLHGITDPNAVKIDWNFGDYTFTNNHGYENIEIYAMWLVDELKKGEETIPQTTAINLNTLKAFPSAQGHGADVVTGGKGGKIMYVTSLANNTTGSYDAGTDTYSGSFKYCLTRTVPGYLIFRVSGKITASSNSDYYFTSSSMGDKTIMGGTAPYPGIVFTGARFRTSGVGHNWIWRGITWTVGPNGTPGSEDAFSMVEGTEEIIFSDNSAGWAYDEAFSIGNTNNSIAQRNFAFELEPSHNTGSIFSTDLSVSTARQMSIHNNVYSLISKRFPNLRGRNTDTFDAVNNSAYGYSTQFGSHKGGLRMNDINNYYVPDSGSGSTPNKRWNADTEAAPSHEDPLMYTDGNVVKGYFDGTVNSDEFLWEQHVTSGGYTAGDALPSGWFANTPFTLGTDIELKTAIEAYNYNVVGKNVGARFYMDDTGVRQKYIHPFVDDYFEDFINETENALLGDETQFIIPALPTSGTPYTDTDNDGMADAWETLHGLNVGTDDKEATKLNWTIDGANFTNNAGFTNIQIFDDYVHGGFVWLKDQNGL